MNIRFKAHASRDVERAFAWYEEQRSGLGVQFREELGNTLAKVAQTLSRTQSFARALAERFFIAFRTSSSTSLSIKRLSCSRVSMRVATRTDGRKRLLGGDRVLR